MMESAAMRLDREIAGLAKARRRLLAKIAGLLLEMKRGKHFKAFACANLADYAASRLEFSAWKTRDLVELAERAESLPEIRAAFESGDVHWTKLRAIARVASVETERAWLAKAAALSARQLEVAIAGAAAKVRIVLELSVTEAADLEDAVRALRQERGECCSREQAVIALVKRGAGDGSASASANARPPFRTVIYRCEGCGHAERETREGPVPVPPATAARAACDADVVDGQKRLSRTIPPAVRRHVLARDRWRCIVPGCSGRDFVEVHHVIARAEGGDHDPARLVTLCTRHHAAVHEGVLRIEGTAPHFRCCSREHEAIACAGLPVMSP